MGIIRAIICIICPPLAVLDKGCGSFILVFFLTLVGWVPGVIAALLICSADEVSRHHETHMHAPDHTPAKDETIDIEAKEL